MADNDIELMYATKLARALWRDHYARDAPQWEPYSDLYGVLSQIDNMITGLSRETPTRVVAWRGITGGFVTGWFDGEPDAVAIEDYSGDTFSIEFAYGEPPATPADSPQPMGITDEQVVRACKAYDGVVSVRYPASESPYSATKQDAMTAALETIYAKGREV